MIYKAANEGWHWTVLINDDVMTQLWFYVSAAKRQNRPKYSNRRYLYASGVWFDFAIDKYYTASLRDRCGVGAGEQL